MATVDSLDIKISAEASKANKAIGILSQNLTTLSKNLGRLNGNSLSNFSSAMQKLSVGMKNLQGIKAKDFTPIAKGIQKFEKLDTGKIASIGGALQPLANGISVLSNTKFDNKNLQNFINSLTRLANANVSGLANVDFTAIGNSIRTLANSLAGAEKVQQSTISITNAVANLAKSGANIPIVASSLPQLSVALKNFINSMSGASAVSAQTITFTQAIAQLSNAGAKAAATASGLGVLSTELKKFMAVMSTAPMVSNNVIQMTNALANLASQGGRVGAASGTLVSGLNRSSSAMNRASKSSMSLAAAFGKFYANWFLMIRAIKLFGKIIKSSMNYVETLNYFNKAFKQIAEKADYSQFEEMGKKAGEEAAKEYADSFAKRAEELTAQMTGFAVTDKGTLETTGMPSLGINPSQLMQYQAMFGQMASSMGVASETSLKLSRALTEIGADLASVKNMDFDKVWTDMASGLAGMSRTLDKYGVNIRNVNLQQKLLELGINANIQALNQNDKALLRAIILLDSTRYAWGDMADTINQPANQLRLVKASFQNLGRTIGDLFLPLVQKLLPYINALTIALQRLFTWLGNLLGIDLSKITNSVGSTDFSEFIEGAEDMSDGLDDASDSAKKLKQQLQGFDELNVLSSQDTSDTSAGSASGLPSGLLDAAFEDALSKYQEEWDEAFANMENRAQELADNIEKALQPVRDIITDFAIGDFFKAGQDTSNLIVGITDFFTRAISDVDWYKIGRNIGEFLAGLDWSAIFSSLGRQVWEGINSAIELWKGSFDVAPFETAFLSILALPVIAGFGSKLVSFIAAPLKGLIGIITPIISSISAAFSSIGSTVSSVGAAIGGLSTTALIAAGAVAVLAGGLVITFVNNEDVRTSFDNALTSIKEGLQPAIEFFTGTLLPDLEAGWNKVSEVLRPFGDFLNNTFTSIWQDMLNPTLTYLGETVLPTLTATFENLWNEALVPLGGFLADVFEPAIRIISGILDKLWKNIVVPLANALRNILGKAFEGIHDIINDELIPGLNTIINVFRFLWDELLEPIVTFIEETFEPTFTAISENIGDVIDDISTTIGGLIDNLSGTFTDDCEKALEGFVDIFGGFCSTVIDTLIIPLNLIVGLVNGMLSAVEKGLNAIIGAINNIKIDVPDWVPGIGGSTFGFSIPSVSFGEIGYLSKEFLQGTEGFEMGGFPEPASLFWAGEGGAPELLGTVGGKTAVAGGTEITGISDAVYSTGQTEADLLRTAIGLLQIISEKEYGITSSQVFESVRKENQRFKERTGGTAFT